MGKDKKFDRLKVLKKISREENKIYGRAGVHKDKKDKRQKRLRTEDYLADVEELDVEELDVEGLDEEE